jgi:hypothetical protein
LSALLSGKLGKLSVPVGNRASFPNSAVCDIFIHMSTLAEIKAAVDSLPSEQKEELLRFLAERLRGRANDGGQSTVASGNRGFPVSKGRDHFTSADVVEIEIEAEIPR